MENTTMTKGIDPMSMSHTRIRIERSQSALLLAPVHVEAWGTTLSADARALGGGLLRGGVAGYASVITDQIADDQIAQAQNVKNPTITTPFMDVDHLRSGRPPV